MIKNPICSLCDEEGYQSVWTWKGIQNGCCQHCGHVYSITTDEEYGYETFTQKYPDEYLLDPNNSIFELANSRVARLNFDPGCALEVGCSYGHFLYLLKQQSWDVRGIEPSIDASEFARNHFGLNVSTDTYDVDGEECFSNYDLISIFHVLEHVVSPASLLKRIYRDLKPGGLIAVAVPNILTLPLDFIELYFIAKGWHQHCFHPVHLINMLENTGFHILEAGDEASTKMSPSSYFVLAEKQEHDERIASTSSARTDGCALISSYHEKMEKLRCNLSQNISELIKLKHRVAFFGAGIHTQAVLELCQINPGVLNCIVDDDPEKIGNEIHGIKIVSVEDELAKNCDVFIVSTLVSEATLVEMLKLKWSQKIIYGIYQDLMKEKIPNGR